MYIQHIDTNGNELGLYRSIREASKQIDKPVSLLATIVRHGLELADGTRIKHMRVTKQDKTSARKRIQQALTEYINKGTHYKLLSHKYNIRQNEIARAISKHEEEKRLSAAHLDFLTDGKSVHELAQIHDVSPWKLGRRIGRGRV